MASGGSVIKSGFLKIEIERGKYVTQWIELTNKALNYFDKKEKSTFFFVGAGRAQNGRVVLDYHSHVVSNPQVSDGLGFSITYKDGKPVNFIAETLKEKKEWMDIIEDIINEEEVDSRLSDGGRVHGTPPRHPSTGSPAEPIATPSSRPTYKSYLKDYLEISKSRNGPWKQVWFILSMEALTYYSSASATSSTQDRIGSLAISESTEVHTDDDDISGSEFIFRLKTKDQTMYLAAISEESRLQWMNTIHSVKKMNMCRAEGDLATMWKWEESMKNTMSVEVMPTDPRFKLRSASIFGFRPGSFDNEEGNSGGDKGTESDDDFFSTKNLVPKGLNKVFGAIESGAQSTVSGISRGISKGAEETLSGIARGIDTLDEGRRLVQDGLVEGTDSLIHTLDSGCSMFIPTFGEDGLEDFEARSDSFCEYDDDEEEGEEEAAGEDIGKTWKTSQPKSLTLELTSMMTAVATVVGGVALLLLLFITHSIVFNLGYMIMALECCIFGLLFFLSYQHVLGYLLGVAVRYKLTNSIHGDGTKFDIHFDAIKLSIGMDLCEVEIREMTWMNPDKFKGSYGQTLLKIKAVRVTVPTLSLYRLIVHKKKMLKIDQILLDSPLVTLAQAGHGNQKEYNITAAVGQSEADNSNTISARNSTVPANVPSHSPPPPHPPPTSSSNGKGNDKSKSTTPFSIDLNFFIMVNLKVRLRNVFKVKSNNLLVPHVVMTRKELTRSPKVAGGRRVPLSVPDLVGVVGKEVGTELMASNKVAMLAILSSSGARHLLALFDPRNLAKVFSPSS